MSIYMKIITDSGYLIIPSCIHIFKKNKTRHEFIIYAKILQHVEM